MFVIFTVIYCFQLGEVELTTTSEDTYIVEEATHSLDNLAGQLGLQKQLTGKLNHCLQTQKPEAYRILSGIIKNRKDK